MAWPKLDKITPKTFQAINFGCRTNAAETNQLSQILIDQGFKPSANPKVFLINTCAITKKGQVESLSRIRVLHRQHPHSIILVTGCAHTQKIKKLNNVFILNNPNKEKLLAPLNCAYTQKIGDKFSSSKKFILKIQSGCNHFCSYCIVPYRRPYLWSLPIATAINTVNKAIKQKYQEIIITGINLNLYKPGLSNLLKNLLTKTNIKKISFGSVPLNCIDKKFIDLYKKYPHRLSNFLHIPLQSGSNKILKTMNRPYTRKQILNIFTSLREALATKQSLRFGTDIIVGFPGETEKNFQDTYDLCKKIGFKKIHVFRYSPRPGTKAQILFDKLPKIKNSEKKSRSQKIRNLVKQ